MGGNNNLQAFVLSLYLSVRVDSRVMVTSLCNSVTHPDEWELRLTGEPGVDEVSSAPPLASPWQPLGAALTNAPP